MPSTDPHEVPTNFDRLQGAEPKKAVRDPHEVERVEERPVDLCVCVRCGYPTCDSLGCSRETSIGHGGPFRDPITYYPSSSPNVLSPENAQLLADALTGSEKSDDFGRIVELIGRLKDYAKDPKGVTDDP